MCAGLFPTRVNGAERSPLEAPGVRVRIQTGAAHGVEHIDQLAVDIRLVDRINWHTLGLDSPLRSDAIRLDATPPTFSRAPRY